VPVSAEVSEKIVGSLMADKTIFTPPLQIGFAIKEALYY